MERIRSRVDTQVENANLCREFFFRPLLFGVVTLGGFEFSSFSYVPWVCFILSTADCLFIDRSASTVDVRFVDVVLRFNFDARLGSGEFLQKSST